MRVFLFNFGDDCSFCTVEEEEEGDGQKPNLKGLFKLKFVKKNNPNSKTYSF